MEEATHFTPKKMHSLDLMRTSSYVWEGLFPWHPLSLEFATTLKNMGGSQEQAIPNTLSAFQ
jgi:hypothetical protein